MQKNELLVFGPALKFPVLLNRYPVFDSVQSLSQGAHDSRSQSVSGLYSNISGGGAIRCNKNGTNITPGQAFTDEWGLVRSCH